MYLFFVTIYILTLQLSSSSCHFFCSRVCTFFFVTIYILTLQLSFSSCHFFCSRICTFFCNYLYTKFGIIIFKFLVPFFFLLPFYIFLFRTTIRRGHWYLLATFHVRSAISSSVFRFIRKIERDWKWSVDRRLFSNNQPSTSKPLFVVVPSLAVILSVSRSNKSQVELADQTRLGICVPKESISEFVEVEVLDGVEYRGKNRDCRKNFFSNLLRWNDVSRTSRIFSPKIAILSQF